MDDETLLEMARRMSGGHPIGDVRGQEDLMTHKAGLGNPAVLPEMPPAEEDPKPEIKKAKGKK